MTVTIELSTGELRSLHAYATARLNPADQTYADILTLDPTPAFFALINAVRELADRLATLEAKL